MPCQCAYLSEEQFPRIARTFNEAFADYYLKSTRKAEEWLYNRAIKNAVEYDHSVGVFDGDRMVGFTLIGIDQWRGELTAFDAGTGMIPDYRGKGLAKQMFDFMEPKLRNRGVKRFLLEVLQVNASAIKAYEKFGFKVTREFDCLGLDYRTFGSNGSINGIAIRPVGKDQLADAEQFLDWQPSWENSFETIRRIPDEVVINGAYAGNELVGILVYYPLLNWIMSLVVRRDCRRQGVATALLSDFVANFDRDVAQINIVNVERADGAMLSFLAKMGFKLFTSQYEMERQMQD